MLLHFFVILRELPTGPLLARGLLPLAVELGGYLREHVSQLVRGDRLEQIIARLVPQRGSRILKILVARNDDEPDVGMALAARLQKRDAVHDRHVHVRNDDVVGFLLQTPQRLDAVGSLSCQLEPELVRIDFKP